MHKEGIGRILVQNVGSPGFLLEDAVIDLFQEPPQEAVELLFAPEKGQPLIPPSFASVSGFLIPGLDPGGGVKGKQP